MKFLIQIPQLIFGGAEKVLVSFANDLVSRGHEVEVLETYEKGLLKEQFDNRVTFHAICSNAYTARYYASWKNIKEERNPAKKALKCGKKIFSMVVGYEKYAEKLARKHYKNRCFDIAINYLEIQSPRFMLSSIQAKKYLQWYHTDVGNLEHPEETDCIINDYERMDAIICVAHAARDSFVNRYPHLVEKTHVIYNFYDVDAIQKASLAPFKYQKFDSQNIVLLSVGRMTPQKKYLRFLDVLKQLKDEGFSFEWHVVGTGYQLEEIKDKVEQLGLQRNVVLEGTTDNPYKYMKNCDLFVLPSGWEGFPTVTIEAKILNCAVLATDVSGIREQLVHGVTGWIVENSGEAIYQGLRQLFIHPDVIKKLQDNSGMEQLCSNDKKYQLLVKLCGRNENEGA